MNNLDEFWFWAMKAIAEPQISNNIHFYNKQKDELFALKVDNNTLSPMYRNIHVRIDQDIVEAFSEEISKVKNSDPNIFILPKLTLEQKKSFLKVFVSNIKDASLKSLLNSEINSLTEIDQFNFKANLKELDGSLYFNFYTERDRFIANKVKEVYYPLGISEKSSLLW